MSDAKRKLEKEEEMARILPASDDSGGRDYGTNPEAGEDIDPEIKKRYKPLIDILSREPTPAAKLRHLRAMPISMQEKLQLQTIAIGRAVHADDKGLTCAEVLRRCRSSGRESASRYELWRRSLKSVEGMYGTGVASFFIFLRALLYLNIVLFLFLFGFVILPQAFSASDTAEANMIDHLMNSSAVAAQCSLSYSQNMTAMIAKEGFTKKLQDILAGTGWMERTILFYGYYYPVARMIYEQSYDYPVAYLLTMGVFFFISLILVLVQTGRSFKESNVEEKTRTFEKYGRLLFASWDYTLVDENAVRLKHRLIYNEIFSELSDEHHAKRHQNLTTGQRCALYGIRIVINFVILLMLIGAAWLIYFVQNISATFTSSTEGKNATTMVKLIMEFLPSLTISAIGAVYPIIFKLMVKAEDYKSENIVLITLCRTVFVKLFAVVVLVIALYSLITCPDKDECNIGIGKCKSISCWETYVGQQFYKLLILSFLIAVATCFAVETPRALLVKYCPCKLAQKIGRAEFDTPKNVLELIYIQIIVWFGTLFCPFLPGITLVSLIIIFYLKLFSCYYNYQPSQQPYKASRSRFFFLIVLAFAYLLCVIPIGYCVVKFPVSRSCGPFRNRSTMYSIIPATISGWTSVMRNLFQWLGSAAFGFLGFIIMLSLVIYFATMSSTRHALNKRLAAQIHLGDRDRQILYRQLVDAGIEPKLSDRIGRPKDPEDGGAPKTEDETPMEMKFEP